MVTGFPSGALLQLMKMDTMASSRLSPSFFMGGECGREVWEGSVGGKHGREAWEGSVGGKCGSWVWERGWEYVCEAGSV